MKTGLRSKMRLSILLMFLVVSTVIPVFYVCQLPYPQGTDLASYRIVNLVGENVTVTETITTTITETSSNTTTVHVTTVTTTHITDTETTTATATTTDVRRKSSGGTASTNLIGSAIAFVQSVAASIQRFIQSIIDGIVKAFASRR